MVCSAHVNLKAKHLNTARLCVRKKASVLAKRKPGVSTTIEGLNGFAISSRDTCSVDSGTTSVAERQTSQLYAGYAYAL